MSKDTLRDLKIPVEQTQSSNREYVQPKIFVRPFYSKFIAEDIKDTEDPNNLEIGILEGNIRYFTLQEQPNNMYQENYLTGEIKRVSRREVPPVIYEIGDGFSFDCSKWHRFLFMDSLESYYALSHTEIYSIYDSEVVSRADFYKKRDKERLFFDREPVSYVDSKISATQAKDILSCIKPEDRSVVLTWMAHAVRGCYEVYPLIIRGPQAVSAARMIQQLIDPGSSPKIGLPVYRRAGPYRLNSLRTPIQTPIYDFRSYSNRAQIVNVSRLWNYIQRESIRPIVIADIDFKNCLEAVYNIKYLFWNVETTQDEPGDVSPTDRDKLLSTILAGAPEKNDEIWDKIQSFYVNNQIYQAQGFGPDFCLEAAMRINHLHRHFLHMYHLWPSGVKLYEYLKNTAKETPVKVSIFKVLKDAEIPYSEEGYKYIRFLLCGDFTFIRSPDFECSLRGNYLIYSTRS